MRILRAPAAAYACAELFFWCWSSHQSRIQETHKPRYIEGPSGRPFTQPMRRKEMDRILTAEYGLEEDGTARTPERGRQWFSGWCFGMPFEHIEREQARTFLAWAYFNHGSAAALAPAEAAEVDADIATFERLGGRTLGTSVHRSFRRVLMGQPHEGEQPAVLAQRDAQPRAHLK